MDIGNGVYPDGSADIEEGKDGVDGIVPSAEACFQELFDSEILNNEEFLFWLNLNGVQCHQEKPDEDSNLMPGENYWEYIAGLSNQHGSLPLIFEASDSGQGKRWTDGGGHPWDRSVVIGYADGASCRRESLNGDGELRTNRAGKKGVQLIVPNPGQDGWPPEAVIAPATQFNPDWQRPPRPIFRGDFLILLLPSLLLGICVLSGLLMVCDRKRERMYARILLLGLVLLVLLVVSFVIPVRPRVI